MKTRWLTPCFILLASCASFAGDDTQGPDDDLDAASPTMEEDAAADATSSVVTPPDGIVEEKDDAGEDSGSLDAGAVDAAPPSIDELTETYGIFVSLAGSLDGDGSREAPLSTIGAGIVKAKKDGKRVYVCKGTYREAVELKSGVSVFGGYACTTKWERKDGEYSRVEAPTSPAVRAKDITDVTTFSGFDVLAPNGSAANASSIGLIADNAGKLVVAASKITAGKGADGAPGIEPAARVPGPSIVGESGRARRTRLSSQPKLYPNRIGGGAGGVSACGGGVGGAGGTGAYATCNCTLSGNNLVCAASVPSTCYIVPNVKDSTCGRGAPIAGTGNIGKSGDDGESAFLIGSLSSEGYLPADGTIGTNGMGGAGGAGGTAEPVDNSACSIETDVSYASGPGGGAGGCGGVAGTPGKGGGASIAALVWWSPGLVFDGTVLVGGVGGAGGKGTLGSSPTAGGSAGSSPPGAGAASKGGNGGRPGVSGSGTGGPSLGVALAGPAPQLVNGAVAKGGKGGAGVAAQSKTALGVTWTLDSSPEGVSESQYNFFLL